MRTKTFFLILAVLFLAGCRSDLPASDNRSDVNFNNSSVLNINQYDAEEANRNTNVALPSGLKKFTVPGSLDYPVAFAPQAPYAVWDALHEEACEEAAMIMVAKYFNQEPLDAHLMEQGILSLIKWEDKNGYLVDLTAAEVRDILINYFKLKATLVTEVTPDRIKEELAKGSLIIVPAAGRDLGNPYFQTPGPIYHMLVIRGYNQSEFITNDPGTKRGNGFKYQYQQLISAIHNWNHSLAADGMTDEEIRQGEKVMVVVNK